MDYSSSSVRRPPRSWTPIIWMLSTAMGAAVLLFLASPLGKGAVWGAVVLAVASAAIAIARPASASRERDYPGYLSKR